MMKRFDFRTFSCADTLFAEHTVLCMCACVCAEIVKMKKEKLLL